MAALHLREEEVKAQMAALEEKTRELESRLQETKDFSVRLSRLVVRVIEGFLQQSQELSFIKFLLTAVILGAGSDALWCLVWPRCPSGRAWIRGSSFHLLCRLLLVGVCL